jgi:hypothetical protein
LELLWCSSLLPHPACLQALPHQPGGEGKRCIDRAGGGVPSHGLLPVPGFFPALFSARASIFFPSILCSSYWFSRKNASMVLFNMSRVRESKFLKDCTITRVLPSLSCVNSFTVSAPVDWRISNTAPTNCALCSMDIWFSHSRMAWEKFMLCWFNPCSWKKFAPNTSQENGSCCMIPDSELAITS